jgi:hypothetical protein
VVRFAYPAFITRVPGQASSPFKAFPWADFQAAKGASGITSGHLKGLRHLAQDHPKARRVVVCLEPKRRRTDDGIEILPVQAFVDDLAAGGLF